MIIEDIYKVFGDNLPESRSAYSAKDNKPHLMLAITKKFKTWKNFVIEYNKYAITQRNSKPTTVEKVVEKKVPAYVTKQKS